MGRNNKKGGFGKPNNNNNHNNNNNNNRNNNNRNNNTNRPCRFCKSTQHTAADCPRMNQYCTNCHKKGHYADDCKSQNNIQTCTNCLKTGHLAITCRSPPVITCSGCGSPDHLLDMCPTNNMSGNHQFCKKCFKSGHLQEKCTVQRTYCFHCKVEGHNTVDCYNAHNANKPVLHPVSNQITMGQSASTSGGYSVDTYGTGEALMSECCNGCNQPITAHQYVQQEFAELQQLRAWKRNFDENKEAELNRLREVWRQEWWNQMEEHFKNQVEQQQIYEARRGFMNQILPGIRQLQEENKKVRANIPEWRQQLQMMHEEHEREVKRKELGL